MKPMSKLMGNPGIYAAAVMLCALSGGASAQTARYAPPLSPRAKLNFDLNWKFVRDDVPGAEAPSFDDSAWTTVGTPHTFNDVDSFRQIISHSGGDRGTLKAWPGTPNISSFRPNLPAIKSFSNSRGCAKPGISSSMANQSGSTRTGCRPTAWTSPAPFTSETRKTSWR